MGVRQCIETGCDKMSLEGLIYCAEHYNAFMVKSKENAEIRKSIRADNNKTPTKRIELNCQADGMGTNTVIAAYTGEDSMEKTMINYIELHSVPKLSGAQRCTVHIENLLIDNEVADMIRKIRKNFGTIRLFIEVDDE